MKTFLRRTCLLWVFLGGLLLLNACKQPDSTPTPAPPPALPTIVSVDPATAPVGSTLAINGTNFSTTPGSNTVLIGGVPATVVSATPTRLVVTVPEGAQNGPIAVTVGTTTVQTTTSFTVAPKPPKPVVNLQGTLRGNITLSRDTIYLLRGFVYVADRAVMTIQPGTVIRGAGPELDPFNENRPGTLLVERGGRLLANGTAAQPIIFTSNKGVGQRAPGDWGGVVLIGKSPTNRPGVTPYFAGIRGTAETYNEPDDNSGSLQYVRIEFAGTGQRSAANPQLGGLTMIGVGRGTIISNVQVAHSSGDGFAWYGGTVNARNLLAYRVADDNWSTNWGYTGNVQFGVGLRDVTVADASGSNGFEAQNYDPGENADGTPLTRLNGLPQTAPVFANMSDFAFNTVPTALSAASPTGFYQSGIYLRNNTGFSLYNSVISGYPEGIRLEGTATGLGNSLTAATGTVDLRGITFANVLTTAAGGGDITGAQANAFVTTNNRSNAVVASGDVATLLLNGATFSLAAPNFVPQTGSPLLSGAVSGGRLGSSFFAATSYRGAFGTDNWLAGWANYNPQTTDYDR